MILSERVHGNLSAYFVFFFDRVVFTTSVELWHMSYCVGCITAFCKTSMMGSVWGIWCVVNCAVIMRAKKTNSLKVAVISKWLSRTGKDVSCTSLRKTCVFTNTFCIIKIMVCTHLWKYTTHIHDVATVVIFNIVVPIATNVNTTIYFFLWVSFSCCWCW